MNRDTATAIGLFALIGLAVYVYSEGDAKAEPGPGPGPGPTPGPIGPIIADPVGPVGPIIAEPVVPTLVANVQIPIASLFVAGAICGVDGGSYNANQWPDPGTVAAALTILGYPVSSTLQGSGDDSQVMLFQLRARELSLEGMQAAPDGFIDGVMGPCTLRALTEAAMISNAGAWVKP